MNEDEYETSEIIEFTRDHYAKSGLCLCVAWDPEAFDGFRLAWSWGKPMMEAE